MDGSFLQRLKLTVHMLFPLSGDAVLVLVGLGAYLATCLVTRHALTWGWALMPGLVLVLALEAWEVWDHYRLAGLSRTGPMGLLEIAARHSRDVLIFNLAPVAVWASANLLDKLVRG